MEHKKFAKDIPTKYTGVYKCPDKIENFKIKIKLQEYTKGLEEKTYQRVFSWQEKHFSKFEREFYSQETNCLTEVEKQYHNRIVESEQNENMNLFLFSYIKGDQFAPSYENDNLSYLERKLANVEMKSDKKAEISYNFFDVLQNSLDEPLIYTDFDQMLLMADLGEYVENIWVKNEQILCDVKYDKISKNLYVYPDFVSTTPYNIQIEGETIRNVYYFIENASEKLDESLEKNEKELIEKVNSQKALLKKQKIGNTFELPPKNKLFVYVFFEILSGIQFEHDDIFVQYFVNLPEKWICNENDKLNGLTQVCRATGEMGLVHFNHCFDFVLEYTLQDLNKNEIPQCPCIYFEVFSKDDWDRFRTEGLCYKSIPISYHGIHTQNLKCFRLCSNNPKGELRRFFIGDCQNYDDITWIGNPKDHTSDVINKFGINTAATGELNIRMNILHHSQAFLEDFTENTTKSFREKMIFEKLNSSSLIKSVEQVLEAFKKARKDMIDARKQV